MTIERHHLDRLAAIGREAQEKRMLGIRPGNWCKPRRDDIAEVLRASLNFTDEEVLIEDIQEGWTSTISVRTRSGQHEVIGLDIFLGLYHFVAMTRHEIILAGLDEL